MTRIFHEIGRGAMSAVDVLVIEVRLAQRGELRGSFAAVRWMRAVVLGGGKN